MKPSIVIGSAVTVAVLAIVAALMGTIAAGSQGSVNAGVTTRAIAVVAAIVVTGAFWWLRMSPGDAPESLFAGLVAGWVLTPTTWDGHGFVAQLFTDITVGRVLLDLVLWAVVAFGVVWMLVRSSAKQESSR